MNDNAYVSIGMEQVLAAIVMILLAMGLSWLNRSKLEKQYLVGAIRSFVQLWLVGYVLLWLFTSNNLFFILLTIEVMLIAGTLTASQRQERYFLSTSFAIFLALHASVLLVGGYLFWVVLRVQPVEDPHIFIPLMGMLIGNAANGASLTVHRLRSEIETHKGEIETALSLGASPRKATEPYVAITMRNALIPSINSMMLMGIVQIPGIMTGQMISGIVPQQAVKYQIVVIYMIAGSVALACYVAAFLETREFFDSRWRLRDRK